MSDADLFAGLRLSKAPLPMRYVAALGLTGVATILAISVDQEVAIPNLSLVFVVPVIVTAVTFGWGPSLFSAILGALAFNFFLTEPRYTLRVEDPANVWAIGLLFVVGSIASAVASTSRRRADEASLRERQAAVLQSYGHDLVAATSAATIAATTAGVLKALFQVPAVVLLMEEESLAPTTSIGGVALRENEVEAARSSLATRTVVRAGVYPAEASRFDFWPVATPSRREAVIGLEFEPDRRPFAPDALVGVVRSCLALALDRQHYAAEVSRSASHTRKNPSR
jgi:K+-sensing histidine kinase KdpD